MAPLFFRRTMALGGGSLLLIVFSASSPGYGMEAIAQRSSREIAPEASPTSPLPATEPLQRAQAAPQSIYFDRQAGEPYQRFLQRAVSYTSSLVEQNFQDPSQSQTQVTLVGRNGSLVAPILMIDVSRNQWVSFPDVEQWGRFFQESRTLLGFDPSPSGGDRPTPASATAPANTSPDATPSPAIAPAGSPFVLPPRSTDSNPGTANDSTPESAPTPTPSPEADLERERFGFPRFPRRSDRFRILDDGTVLEVEDVSPTTQ